MRRTKEDAEQTRRALLDAGLRVFARQGYAALFLTPEVVAAQQKIADSFYQLKLIPKPLSIKDVIWTPPAAVAKAQ